jgi:orotate phosphoribosyltransferase
MKISRFDFIRFCLQHQVMRFGEFTLKSGRLSPYFFNAGLFNGGAALALLGRYYAQTLLDSGIGFDMLFGPAYKGIPLVSTAAIAFAEHHHQDVPYCFNRKEVKAHGEGGQLVGAALRGRVIIIDDVITAGTAIKASVEFINASEAQLAGVVVLLDRQERGAQGNSAIKEIEQHYQVPILHVICLQDIIAFVQQDSQWQPYLDKIKAYQQRWGI